MPDVPSAPDEVAALRAASARLRAVVEAKDTEIAALRTSHQAQLDVLRAQVTALAAEVADLRARLGQSSRNSSRPPSSDGPGTLLPRSLRGKTGRKPGRPKGQPGVTLAMTGRPDEVLRHEPARCAGCGAGLAGAPVTRVARRQVTDLPERIRALVTEHQVISRRCGCGRVTAGTAPEGVTAPVQYGPRIAAASDPVTKRSKLGISELATGLVADNALLIFGSKTKVTKWETAVAIGGEVAATNTIESLSLAKDALKQVIAFNKLAGTGKGDA